MSLEERIKGMIGEISDEETIGRIYKSIHLTSTYTMELEETIIPIRNKAIEETDEKLMQVFMIVLNAFVIQIIQHFIPKNMYDIFVAEIIKGLKNR